MPDGEVAVVGEGKHEVATVVRRAWEGYALALGGGVYKGIYAVAERTGGGIERDAAKVVTDLLVLGGYLAGLGGAEV